MKYFVINIIISKYYLSKSNNNEIKHYYIIIDVCVCAKYLYINKNTI